MNIAPRLRSAAVAASIHLICSLAVAAVAGALVLGLWYPYPYREMSGGRELFFLIVGVDVVCGPLLTMVLYNPSKPRSELWRDLGLVGLIQLLALGYGLATVLQARPLFLAHERDRFKVVMAADVDSNALAALPAALKPGLASGPLTIALREPASSEERNRVMLESVQGGRDYAERPEFYLPYDRANAVKSLKLAKPLSVFLEKRPDQVDAANKLASQKGAAIADWQYLPIIARQDWVAVLDKQGQIQGFLKGDGF
jgi:hypothetical protein